MAKTKFTAGRIASFNCAVGKSQDFLWDSSAPGLGLRATPRGDKSYFFQSKLDGKSLRITIGSITNWAIPDAEAEARRLQTLIDNGHDPRQIKNDGLVAAQNVRDAMQLEQIALQAKAFREAVTLGDVWPKYVADRLPLWSPLHHRDHLKIIQSGGMQRSRSRKLTEPGPLASLASERLVDLTMERIEDWAKVEAKVRPSRARLALRLLKACLFWCAGHKDYREFILTNAAQSKRARESLGKPANKRHDSLQKEQLPFWFSEIRKIQNPVISAYLQGLLITGARREELAALRWEEVDFRWKTIKLADKMEPFRIIPLTPYLSELLSALPRENEWVFSSSTSASGHITEPSIAHRKACAAAGVSLSIHGLRRSFSSLSVWVEVPESISRQIMGHSPGDVHVGLYTFYPIGLLRQWHTKIESWILTEAQLEFGPR
jgi:integrase